MKKTKKSCWWNEGDRCYKTPCERMEDGRSHKKCTTICGNYTSKREVLRSVIPEDKLIILSEEKEK